MSPLSSAILILGYLAGIPLAAKMPFIVKTQNRIAMAGHQSAFIFIILGWLLRQATFLAFAHALWLGAAVLWFKLATFRQRSIQHGEKI